MKYLEDEKLTQLTRALTDVVLPGRVVNGRMEAFTMKRAGTDKKYAHALGERFVAEREQREMEMAEYKDFYSQKSISRTLMQKEESRRKKRSISLCEPGMIEPPVKASRARSFDETKPLYSSPGGDFLEIGNRRLMTDLILTLNASFPDYDFGNVRPADFLKKSVLGVMEEVNDRLSEFASRNDEHFLKGLWNAIDSVICLSETEIFTYVPPTINDDPIGFLTETLLEHEGSKAGGSPLWSFNFFFVNKNLKRILLFVCVETMSIQDDSFEEELEDLVTFGRFRSSEIDYDIDPSSDVAGGIPIGN
jgi:Maf1 regulator